MNIPENIAYYSLLASSLAVFIHDCHTMSLKVEWRTHIKDNTPLTFYAHLHLFNLHQKPTFNVFYYTRSHSNILYLSLLNLKITIPVT